MMATRGIFIGIDRHADPDINELSGAGRDATAFHALFSDTLTDIDSVPLIDADAIFDRVRDSLRDALINAESGDTVIISFSGHGTHDHRLVLHDSKIADLPGTTIGMEELARWFKDSPAQRVVCVLDCCFSGGAPAKVLEDSPIPRTSFSYQEIAGEGRVIIAASNINEAAYEMPGDRHGLLTKSLLDLLQQGEADQVEVLQLAGQLQALVRAEAGRMGYAQTPVVLGSITGGLVLPRLRRGQRYQQAFPEQTGTSVSADFADLAAFGIRSSVLQRWTESFPAGLNKLQLTAVNTHRILDGASTVVVAPTSSGKTFIGELAALRAVHQGQKAVFLLPYKALVNEKFETFTRLYGEFLRVVRVSGDYGDQASVFVRGKYDLAILTYEMFLGLIVGTPHVLDVLGLVVLDEAQFLADPQRGITVELILTKLLAARELGIAPQVITLGAVVRTVEPFAKWLQASLLFETERPVPLDEGVIDRFGLFRYWDKRGAEQRQALVPPGEIWQRKKKASAGDLLIPLLARLARDDGEKVLIFRNTKGATQGCATYLAQTLGLPAATSVLNALPQQDLSNASTTLRRTLQGGVAFHNTNLTADERAAVEPSFRDPDGKIRVLVSTTTMAAGINTPADTVIICETTFLGEEPRAFTVSEYKNMAGRAGRLGYREQGRSLLVADDPFEARRYAQHYVRGEVEPIQSSFDPAALDTWIIRLLAQVQAVKRTEVIRLLANTFGGYLAAQRDPDWQGRMTTQITTLLNRMVELELLEEEGGEVSLTILGRACGNSAIGLPSALRLVEFFRLLPEENREPLGLMALVQCLPEADQIYTPLYKKRLQKEQGNLGTALSRFGDSLVRLFQRYTRTNADYYARAKRACILSDWIQGTPIDIMERTYSTTAFGGRVDSGTIQSIANTTRWLLPSVADIVLVLAPEADIDISTLAEQLEFGLPAKLLPLAKHPLSLSRGECLALDRAGYVEHDIILSLPDEQLRSLLEPRTILRLATLREKATTDA